ncbi:MAG: ABC transporter permease [Acetobacteraceae bacterium]|nr:ABC transporter permease [Acetobacteraceae bacterium]
MTFMIRRALVLVPLLLVVSAVCFLLLYLVPGDPVRTVLGPDVSPEDIEAYRHELGLDRPLATQFLNFLARIIRGDLGTSIYWRMPVAQLLAARIPATIELALAAFLWAMTVGIMTGVISALRRDTAADLTSTTVAVLGMSVPIFWLGLMLMLVFSVELRWLPTTGREGLRHLILPAVTLGARATALISRMTRSAVLEVVSMDYVRTARAKGLSERVVVYKHVLRNALIPVVTIMGLQLGQLLGGAVVTETVFAWPGIGKLIVDAVKNRDFPVVQAGVLFMASVFVLINMLVDFTYGLIDPRIRVKS